MMRVCGHGQVRTPDVYRFQIHGRRLPENWRGGTNRKGEALHREDGKLNLRVEAAGQQRG
jgi:hypothetical protein